MSQDDAVARLARQIDAARKAERFLVNADEVASLRRRSACELHRICAEFVGSVNSNLSEAALDFSPGTYAAEMFREPGANLIQISSHGREMQIAFEAPPQLVSTEKFLVHTWSFRVNSLVWGRYWTIPDLTGSTCRIRTGRRPPSGFDRWLGVTDV